MDRGVDSPSVLSYIGIRKGNDMNASKNNQPATITNEDRNDMIDDAICAAVFVAAVSLAAAAVAAVDAIFGLI